MNLPFKYDKLIFFIFHFLPLRKELLLFFLLYNIQSESVSFTALASNWWKFDKSYKKSLGIIITRSHKPIIFRAGPLMKLSLQTFVGVSFFKISIFYLLYN